MNWRFFYEKTTMGESHRGRAGRKPSSAFCDTGRYTGKSKDPAQRKKISLKVGQTKKLKVKGTKKKVVWKSSKKKIASVSKKGVVKALRRGKAKITAKTAGKKLVCMVTVKNSKIKPTVIPATSAPATASPLATASAPSASPSATPEVTTTTVPAETPFVSMAPYESGAPSAPALSQKTGVYDEAFKLYMAAQPGTEIYYTTDGSIPTVNSAKYTGSIQISCRNGEKNVLCSEENIKKMDIAGSGYDYVPEDSEVDKCTIIRAAAIAPDGTSSSVITNSYFVGNDMANKYKGATVASLVMDPNDLLDYNTGILALGAYYDEWRKTAEAKQIIQSKAYWNYEGNYTQSGKGWERQATMDYINPSTGNVEFSAQWVSVSTAVQAVCTDKRVLNFTCVKNMDRKI